MLVPLTSITEQQAIAEVLDGIDEAIEQNKSALDKMMITKASTADALLTGRVRVKESLI